tara:strand:+ start:4401 stop:4652 length:252 start_codon:yes stop_codon:yes gene_type:complete
MAHFKSVTFKHKGKWHNIPSVIDGKERSEDEARDIMLKRGNIGPGFTDMNTAIRSAKLKSRILQGPGGKGKAGALGLRVRMTR